MEVRHAIGGRLLHIRASRTLPQMAAVMGVSPRTYAYYEQGERVPDGEALALLVAEGWNANWLLTGNAPERLVNLQVAESAGEYGSHEMSGETLSIAVELTDESLKGLWLPRRLYYDLVALVYDGLTQGLPYAQIIAFARPLAIKMAGESEDDSGAEVGGEGTGDSGRGAAAAKR